MERKDKKATVLKMDNMKYYTGSLAHDFDRFMPSPAPARDNVIALPRQKQAARARTSASVNTIGARMFSVLATCFILGMVCLNIMLRVQITETTAEVSKTIEQIAVLDSEQTRLSVELERKASFENLEAAAQALGMQKLEKSQIVYIRTNQQSAAQTGDGTHLSAGTEQE